MHLWKRWWMVIGRGEGEGEGEGEALMWGWKGGDIDVVWEGRKRAG
jgi:hypothetical protein